MSKKDRLKAQKIKQDIELKELEEQERLDREEAREKQSRAARKMRRRAKHFRPNNEHIMFLVLKILMIVPFAYSGFFWGGVTVVAIKGGQYIDNPPPAWVGYVMLGAIVVMLAGIIFAYFKKYIVSAVMCIGGAAAFFRSGKWFVDAIRNVLDTRKVDDSLLGLDVQYMWRYYPIIALAVISAVLLAMAIVKKIMEKRQIQKERDNAPVDSIVKD